MGADVDAPRGVHSLRVDLGQRPSDLDPRMVVEDVETAMPLQGRPDQPLDGGVIADIRGDGLGASACRLNDPRRFRPGLPVSIGDYDVGALAGHGDRTGSPDAGAGCGYDCNFVLEDHGLDSAQGVLGRSRRSACARITRMTEPASTMAATALISGVT